MARALIVLVLAALVAAAAKLVSEQAGAEPERLAATPLPGLPAYTAGYRNWFKLNSKPIPPRASDPHFGTKNVYASRRPTVSGTRVRYAYGTIVVKEVFRPGKKFVGLIATMRKLRGSDPKHNDWKFVEYSRQSASGRFEQIASGAVCYGCHVGAAKTDYVFTKPSR